LAVLHEAVGKGNTLLAAGTAGDELAAALAGVRTMLDVLGVDPLAEFWQANAGADESSESVIDALVQQQIVARTQAKNDKDYAKADAIRDQLRELGIALEDSADGVRWTLEK